MSEVWPSRATAEPPPSHRNSTNCSPLHAMVYSACPAIALKTASDLRSRPEVAKSDAGAPPMDICTFRHVHISCPELTDHPARASL
eukprot:2583719-Pyramimonas_sp.AAC.1